MLNETFHRQFQHDAVIIELLAQETHLHSLVDDRQEGLGIRIG